MASRTFSAALLATVLAAGPPLLAANDPLFPRQWNLPQIGAPEAWQRAAGAGIVIAVIDTGVDLQHEDLAAKLVPGQDFVNPGTAPQDGHGHGTHVAGIAAAATNNGIGMAGVAPAAMIMPVRVLDNQGGGSGRAVADGIRWAADNGAHVINLSLGDVGQPVFGPSFGEALRYAWGRGVIPVVAAGNDYLLSSGYDEHPALVVAATDRNDRKPDFSSGVGAARWGISAPGGGSMFDDPETNDIWSAHLDSRYRTRRGTSMAAPHVAGAAALLRSLGAGQQRTVDILLETAKDVGSYSTFGHGRLDVARAVAQVAGAPQPAVGAPPPPPQQAPPPPAEQERPPAAGTTQQQSRTAQTPVPQPTGPTDPRTEAGTAQEGDDRQPPPLRAGDDTDSEATRSMLPGLVGGGVLVLLAGGALAAVRLRRPGP